MCCSETTRLSQLPDTDTDTDKGWGELPLLFLHLCPHESCVSPLCPMIGLHEGLGCPCGCSWVSEEKG